MQLGMRKIFIRKKTILLGAVFFASLFFGTEVLAAWPTCSDCKYDNFISQITYTDICPGGECSKLDTCEYRVLSNGVETVSWTSTGYCYDQSGPVTFDVPITVGPDTQNCRDSGLGACVIESRVIDKAGNEGENSNPYNICVGCLINGVCYDSGAYNSDNQCQLCNRSNNKTSWSNVTDGTDPAGWCPATWTSCDSTCVKRGGDGNCYAGACDTNRGTGYMSTTGKVCSNGNEVSPSSSNYCDKTVNCIDNSCSANRYYRGCLAGSSSTCVDTGRVSYTSWNASQNYIISETSYKAGDSCSTNQEFCGYSNYDRCSGDRHRVRDQYRCNGSGSCSYDVGDESVDCGVVNYSCSSVCQRDYTYTCSAGVCGTYHSYTSSPQGYRCEGGSFVNTGYCAESDYTNCSSNSCQRGKEQYLCDGASGEASSCAYKIADVWEDCSPDTACSGGVCSTSNLCDSAWKASTPGDNGYGAGGDYMCQGKCDGNNNCDYAVNCDAKPDCDIQLREQGTVNLVTEVNIEELFDIYVGGSIDDIGIIEVRFSSDNAQDGNPTGSWTQWYTWNVSFGDWSAGAKTKKWSFSTAGYKEVWAEVKDGKGQTDAASGDIYVNYNPNCTTIDLAAPYDSFIGMAPLIVAFVGYGNDPDGSIVAFQWDFDGDGTWDTGALADSGYVHTYDVVGNYCAKLRVQDNRGVWSINTGSCPSGVCVQPISVVEGECTPGDTEEQGCGSGDCLGTQTRTCQADYYWGTWEDCSSSGSQCGTDTGSCDDYCSGLSLVEYDSPTDCSQDSTPISCNEYCDTLGVCQSCTLPDCPTPDTHCCEGVCGAECDEDTDCTCPVDGCIGADWYDYPANGLCSSCACDIGEGTGQPCEPTITLDDPGCDTEDPIVSDFDISPKSPNWVSNSTPDATIDWTVTDSGDSHLSHVEVWRTVDFGGAPDGGQWAQIGSDYNAPADSDSWTSNTTDSPSNGIYWYGLHVLDNAGNMGTEASPIKVLVDKTNPSSAVTAPAAGTWYNNDFSATLDDSDAGGSGLASNCQYLIVGYNPDPLGDDCSSGILSRSCDLADVNVFVGSGSCSVANICIFEGGNRCRVNTQSFDNAGNSSGWQSRNFSIDYSSPAVGEVSPAAAIKNEITTFSASAADTASQITGCWFYEGTALLSADVDFSSVPCTECTISTDYAFDTIGDHENVYFMCQDSAQNYGTGDPVTIAVNPPPTLAVDLAASPGTGVIKADFSGLEDPIDLTAAVSGTMEGTINYKFDCTNDGVWDLEIPNSSVNPYTAADVCDYTAIGLYTAKVFIEKGDGCGGIVECTDAYLAANSDDFCCQEDIIEISVEENQPPVCSVGISARITPSANIYIDVSGSSDPESAMSGVRFSSDNNLNGAADGSWNPAPPNYYNWNGSSGEWDAADKEMKWSFAEIGTYEVWAEVKDDVGQSDSCHGTIIVSECIPGSTENCTSPQGCLHVLTCTAGGEWPSCPTDECTPEDAQNCGVAGTQTCSSFCTWGTCIEPNPECSETPPGCPVCQHPECIAPNWECQPDAAGTDCGNCRECNGSGSCTFVCSLVESSCECITDACMDCSNYYDSTGPTYGYQGLCNCGALEIPLWDCDNGNCICTCWNPEGGDPPPVDPPDPIPDPPPSPPPGDPCEENIPTAAINPFSQAGNAGESLSYDVSVLNNDSLNCDSSTFDLTTGGICNEINWSCSALPDLTIPAGESETTVLTVTSPSSYSRGNYQFSVTADSTTTQAIYQFANNSPSAQSLSVDSHNPTDYCFVAGYPPLRVRWEFIDPDLPEDNQSAYEIEVFQGGVKVVDTGKQMCVSCRSSLFTTLSFGLNYTWQLKVWDSSDVASGWASGPNFGTIAHPYPWPDFDWSPEAPTAGEIIQLEDLTTFYNGFGTWEWDFDGDGMTDSTTRNATTSYSEENPEGYEVSLKVRDGSNYGPCATEQNISIRKPLPEWQEAPPF